ncbi:zinc-binding dehydrogenase [Halalkalibacterium halodurans]|uniref:zinc-dependent alcohol dehydrogenase n=1 Tax=Halalkalibacterium halodurans TaxID=86665 RepID=UPI002E1C5D69|nr:zinc-binding dehydrogenase [Halalkalibacterium halodurans]MED4085909.1 zinc-binding dehydrogenase [Halalkalibacterium halodurans]MED4104003.1 zinc-binding dehydrogenase [Halalkalibacterium halodurans]MED4109846.1 zinc-binding dehydrogenase [Halalkalibacterium halodurans]MED4149388.1 zinc-binding dehydrogenase [Halalkalibacterium halodurans]
MKAIQFDLSIPKYALSKAMGKMNSSLYVESPFSCLQLRDVEKPALPNDHWVEIKVKYGGICGSDLNLIFLNDSPATSPFVSFPFTLGHEMVGTISKARKSVTNLQVGQRVVIDPLLSCEVRGITPVCPECANGNYNLCHHMNDGNIAPGLLTGTCKDTGGSWGRYLVAHQSQVISLPSSVDDDNGVLVEPFACALHAVLQNRPKPSDTVFVIGSGVIGICVIAAIRALEIPCKIVTLAKHPFQAELAKQFGADEIVFLSRKRDYVTAVAESFNANVLHPVFGEPIVHGGADIVYECVGNRKSLHDSLRFARKGGKVVLIGLASFIDNLDMTMIWLNELEVKGSFTYGMEDWQGGKKRTLQIAVDLIADGKVDLSPLITHRFPLEAYREALATAANKKKGQTMKVVFEP